MTLFASTPDGLAEQQRFYDQLYGAAGARNAAAISDAGAQNVRTILAQRELDRRDRQFNADAQQRADQFAQNLAYGSRQADLNRGSNLEVAKLGQEDNQKKYEESVLREAAHLAENGQLSAASVDLYRQSLSPANQARLADIIRNSAATFDAGQKAEIQPYEAQRAEEQLFADRGNSIRKALEIKPKPVISPINPPATAQTVWNTFVNPVGTAARWLGRVVTPESPTILPDTSGMESRLAALTAMTKEKNPRIQIMPDQSFAPVTQVPVMQPNPLAATASKSPAEIAAIRAEAGRAISLGADPKLVAERLAKMGIIMQ